MNNRVAFLTLLLSIVFIFLLTVFKNSVGQSAYGLSFKSKRIINLMVPQGWGFFTRNPREPSLQVYDMNSGKPEVMLTPNAGCEHFFGISRKNRRIGMEASTMVGGIPDSLWTKSKDSFVVPEKVIRVRRTVDADNLLGMYVVVLEDKTPWAWARYPERHKNLFKSIKVEFIN